MVSENPLSVCVHVCGWESSKGREGEREGGREREKGRERERRRRRRREQDREKEREVVKPKICILTMESIGPVLTPNIGSHFQFLLASSYNSPCIAAFLWFRFVARGPVTVHPLRPPDLPKMVARQMLLGIDKQVLFGCAAIGVYVRPVVCSLSLPLIPTHKQSGLQWWLKYAHVQISSLSHTL